MDDIRKNTAKKQRACDLRNTTVKLTITAPVQTANTLPVTTTTTPKWCDPETVTLEQIDENTWWLLREWPKDNGTPFPMEILEVLRDLKLRVRAQDAEQTHSATVSVATSSSLSSRKAAKIAYQNNVVKNGYPLTANQAVIDRATKTAILANTSVEQLDTQLHKMEMAWCRKKTNPFPDHTATPNSNPIGSDTAVTAPAPSPAPAPTHYKTTTTKPPDRKIEVRQVTVTTAPSPAKSQDHKELEKERMENGEEREDGRQQTREENKGSTEREERTDDEGIEETRRDDRLTAPACTANGIACESQRFNWATDINMSIGPVPSANNSCPTTSAPKKPIISMPASPDLTLPKPTVTLSSSDMALRAPTLALSKDPTTLLNCAPIECVDSLPPISHLPACVTTDNTAPAVHEIHGAASPTAITIPIHHTTSHCFVRALRTHGAASATTIVALTHSIHTMCTQYSHPESPQYSI
ncbi:hypothetical protein PILCRDRAFT_91891 [Piloderma croceum F 1598]|uniref:Uncharacterized protein n=1 Tax=Piloderma croceum (strain F 1598) TaxID=765440 RepID=A0A0C3F7H7_PILCF|nr:hypothetical protein PILCRDRAFT_91891 [Piloderma croceum F 1598]